MEERAHRDPRRPRGPRGESAQRDDEAEEAKPMRALGRRVAAAALTAAALVGALGAAPTAQAAARTFIRDAEIEHTLRLMSGPVFEAAGLAPDSVRLFILLDPALNAFVAGGRTMVLNTGLLERLDQAETVIGVIAHETGHITGGHLARREMAVNSLTGPALLATVLAGAAAVAAGSPQAGAALALGSQSAIQRSLLAYSRAEEAAADQAAVTYMSRAEIDPTGMLDILRTFKGQEVFQSRRLDPYALSHPLSSERISLLENRIASSAAVGAPLDPQIAYWHGRMRAKLEGFTQRPERVLARLDLAADPESELNLYRRAVALHRMADAQGALGAIDSLLKIRPDDPYYWELRGQVLFESARPAEAVTAYRRAVALAPDEPLIAGYLGRALLAGGQPGQEAEALEILKRAARDDPGEAGILRDLAQAYARAGDDANAALYTAQRLALGGETAEAARMARRAMDLLPRGSPGWLRAEDIATLADTPAR